MTIKFYDNKIEFINDKGMFTLTETSNGFSFDSTITASEFSSVFQGQVSGYGAGGLILNSSTTNIDKFPLAVSQAVSVNVGSLTATRTGASGQQSVVAGYITSGDPTNDNQTPTNNIQKITFASDAGATSVGSIATAVFAVAGQSSSENGYVSGGATSAGSTTNTIQRFSFASDSTGTSIATLTQARATIGQSSKTHGYASGGTNVIDRFPFATAANATDVGDLTFARHAYAAGISSSENGYVAGGDDPAITNQIDKFPFATNTNAVDSGQDLTRASGGGAVSSTTHGYVMGGRPFVTAVNNIIDRFPFASSTNATDVGDLSLARRAVTGTHR